VAEREDRPEEEIPGTAGQRTGEDQASLAGAAEADDTLALGSDPGGPDYPEEATEGPEGGAPAH
jgi:hypothetical protein